MTASITLHLFAQLGHFLFQRFWWRAPPGRAASVRARRPARCQSITAAASSSVDVADRIRNNRPNAVLISYLSPLMASAHRLFSSAGRGPLAILGLFPPARRRNAPAIAHEPVTEQFHRERVAIALPPPRWRVPIMDRCHLLLRNREIDLRLIAACAVSARPGSRLIDQRRYRAAPRNLIAVVLISCAT
mgnify:CR=1 FL=1